MSRTKGAENLSEFSVYFYPRYEDEFSVIEPDGTVSVIVEANSSVSACMQVIQDFNPIRIVRVFKYCPLPSLVMGG